MSVSGLTMVATAFVHGVLKGTAMAKLRPRVKHALTFEERLAEEARRFKEKAEAIRQRGPRPSFAPRATV